VQLGQVDVESHAEACVLVGVVQGVGDAGLLRRFDEALGMVSVRFLMWGRCLRGCADSLHPD